MGGSRLRQGGGGGGAGCDGDSEVLSLLPGGQTGRTRPRLSSDLGVSIPESQMIQASQEPGGLPEFQ